MSPYLSASQFLLYFHSSSPRLIFSFYHTKDLCQLCETINGSQKTPFFSFSNCHLPFTIFYTLGRNTENIVPFPTIEDTLMYPHCSRIICLAR